MLQLINQRIENNGFRRLISDNAVYQRIMNSLKDSNSPQNERHPNIVDFLALEAMLPVNYNNTYNRSLSEWYQRCKVPEWADNQILVENHLCFEHEMATAKAFLHKQLVQSSAPGGLRKRDASGKASNIGHGKNKSRAAVAAAAAASVRTAAGESDGERAHSERAHPRVDIKQEHESDLRDEMLLPSIEID
ncbi:predicted protein [Verticillium alfalfae VaMs.102]|uniref:Predicted protein n=1 Tax=Verticillium alfalfae (strain VaMs.102 / ATCC MYA-4576 / FGSC 10136) TaxID=526221 RepID=C9SXP3_VERA1|nr:predicted protein [Verticillium alfalfae VaMs.102]EEY23433.1 predicted protein [Verticillium alfalfae VaMs.102]